MTSSLLIVDDDPVNQEILGEYLAGEGFDLTVAWDGAEAWRMLDAAPERFDCVLLDRMMPRMNGMEVLERMKRDERLRLVPVVMQTAAAAPEQVAEGLRVGAYYYLSKPFRRDMLITVVRGALRDRSGIRDLQAQLAKHESFARTICRASFELRTPAEARSLAAALATACPNPMNTSLGLGELLLNAVEHGNLAIGYKEKSRLLETGDWEHEIERRLATPPYRDRHVLLTYERLPERIEFLIRDAGEGFDAQRYLELTPDRAFDSHGRGIALARTIGFTTLEYRGCGNEVFATVRRTERLGTSWSNAA